MDNDDTDALRAQADMAWRLLERWGMVASTQDGEDSAGRARFRLQTPHELVERAWATARLFAGIAGGLGVGPLLSASPEVAPSLQKQVNELTGEVAQLRRVQGDLLTRLERQARDLDTVRATRPDAVLQQLQVLGEARCVRAVLGTPTDEQMTEIVKRARTAWTESQRNPDATESQWWWAEVRAILGFLNELAS